MTTLPNLLIYALLFYMLGVLIAHFVSAEVGKVIKLLAAFAFVLFTFMELFK